MSEPPRLLFCAYEVFPGKTPVAARLAAHLKAAAQAFRLVAVTLKTPDLAHVVQIEGGRLLRVPTGTGDAKAQADTFDRAVRRQVESEPYAVVHFFDPRGGYALLEARKGDRFQAVYEPVSFPSGDPKLDRRTALSLERRELYCLLNADAVAATSATAAHLRSLGVPERRIRLISGAHGALELYEGLLGPRSDRPGPPVPLAHARREARTELGLPSLGGTSSRPTELELPAQEPVEVGDEDLLEGEETPVGGPDD